MNQIKGDIFGGFTAAVIALPLALAFGVASGAGAVAGLYGAIVLGFFAALFGGTPTQISGPTGPMTVVLASAMVLFGGDLSAVMSVILLTGVFQLLFGVMKVGKYVRYIPYPVISGFMSGIGLIIIILQINPLIGVEGAGSVLQTLFGLPDAFAQLDKEALTLSVLTLLIMFFTPQRVAAVIPAPLIALVVMTFVSVLFTFDVRIIGEIPTTMPELVFPSFDASKAKNVVALAITLALLGTIDTLLTSIVADSITKSRHNPNRELIGQGIGNMLVAFVGGIAGAGATMRTVINIKSGGSSRLSGMVHALTLLLVMLFLAPLASQIPLAVLAGILMKVGIDILDYKFLRIIKNAPRNDLIIMAVVFFLTVFVDLIMAVGVGITLASVLIVYRIAKEAQINVAPQKSPDGGEFDEDVRVLNIDGAFFFGSTAIFEDKISQILDTKKIIINCLNVPFMDLSAIFALEEMVLKLKDAQIEISLVLQDRHLLKIKNVDKMHVFDDVNIYRSFSEAGGIAAA